MRRWHWLAALCLLAFALSWAYVVYYLRGGPRIIDATSYLLEARSIAAGSFSFAAVDPSAAFRGRFLLASPDGHTLSVIFPPGYPALLALGVLLGQPMLVGPLLGAGLVVATYFLATALSADRRVALLAAALSSVCAALRYHSADTMSHALSALLLCTALALALRPRWRLGRMLCGLCLGFLVCTRPVSGAVGLLLCGLVLRREGFRAWALLALGALPGISLLLLQQWAVTGHVFGSTQLSYYAVADAPPGCFRYGFGPGVGCRFEHGDFVARFMPNGYGWATALRNLGVHLGLFSVDATNAVPLTLLAVYTTVRHRRSPWLLLGLGVAMQALAYVPFYFDGNYPGGGARFLGEAIPLCQVLVARGAVDLRLERWAVPLSLVGFVLHARAGHEQLSEREGGRPMFEAATLEQASVQRGLVFVDTDHGFNLGHDPRVADPASGVFVARYRGDAHDRTLWQRLGRPPTYLYRYDVRGDRAPSVAPFVPPATTRWEAEAEWPALLERGSAYPVHFPCASRGAALRLYPGTSLRLELGGEAATGWRIGWVGTGPGGARIRISWPGARAEEHALGSGCSTWSVAGPPPGAPLELKLALIEGEGALDFVTGLPGPAAEPGSPPADLTR